MAQTTMRSSVMEVMRLAAITCVLGVNVMWPTSARTSDCQTCTGDGCRYASDNEPRWACCMNDGYGGCNFCCSSQHCDTYCS